MYYTDYKAKPRYALYFYPKDGYRIYLDIYRGKIKVKKGAKVRYLDKDELPQNLHGVPKEMILEKF